MKGIPHIKSVMTPFPFSIDAAELVTKAEEMMKQHNIRHLPVMDNDQLFGIITDRDIKLILDPELGYRADSQLTVKDVCIRHPYVVDLNESLDVVAEEMSKRKIGSVVVLKSDKVCGVFTATDACQFLSDFLRAVYPSGSGGEDLVA